MRILLLFAGAVLVMFLAHRVRTARHSLLFAAGELPEHFALLLALSSGYALNTLLPLRVGEIARAVLIGARLRLRVSYVLATVAVERFSDLVVVAAAALLLARGAGAAEVRLAARSLGLAAVALAAGAVLVQREPAVRRAVWRVTSVFNDRLRLQIVEFVATAAQLLTDGRLWSARYLAATAGMWTLYLGAFALFATAARASLGDVSGALLVTPLRSLSEQALAGGVSPHALALLAFTTSPVAAVLSYGAVRHREAIAGAARFVRRFGLAPRQSAPPPFSRRFRHTRDYAAFLQAHFEASNEVVSRFVTEGTTDTVVHRLLPGGSDAVTALVETHGVLTIRKAAVGDAGRKLQVQAEWLERHGAALPLADVIALDGDAGRRQYDMPYMVSARDFYDVIHTTPAEASWRVLRDVVDGMAAFHAAHARGPAEAATVDAYLERKVIANARRILAHAWDTIGDEYELNGERYRLAEWSCLLDPSWLREQVRHRETAVIHGDLTIENIIVCPDQPGGWYLIDPNPDNVLDSPLIDWAKLMQSLHLGYEGLNRGGPASVQRGGGLTRIQLPFTRSSAYAHLDEAFRAHLARRLCPDALREVAFHELVNYLRLTPYRIRHAPHKALTFIACGSVLLRRYREGAGG